MPVSAHTGRICTACARKCSSRPASVERDEKRWRRRTSRVARGRRPGSRAAVGNPTPAPTSRRPGRPGPRARRARCRGTSGHVAMTASPTGRVSARHGRRISPPMPRRAAPAAAPEESRRKGTARIAAHQSEQRSPDQAGHDHDDWTDAHLARHDLGNDNTVLDLLLQEEEECDAQRASAERRRTPRRQRGLLPAVAPQSESARRLLR